MELSRIIFKDQEVWRAYKNREMIWHQQELKFFDIGNTELFAMPIITYGQGISKEVTAGFILQEIAEEINFFVAQGKNWQNPNRLAVNNNSCFNLDSAKNIKNLNSIFIKEKYSFDIDKVWQIINDNYFNMYNLYTFNIDESEKINKESDINLLLAQDFKADKATHFPKELSIHSIQSRKLPNDLGKKIISNTFVNIYYHRKIHPDLAKRVDDQLEIFSTNLEKIWMDLGIKNNGLGIIKSLVINKVNATKTKSLYGEDYPVFYFQTKIFSPKTKILLYQDFNNFCDNTILNQDLAKNNFNFNYTLLLEEANLLFQPSKKILQKTEDYFSLLNYFNTAITKQHKNYQNTVFAIDCLIFDVVGKQLLQSFLIKNLNIANLRDIEGKEIKKLLLLNNKEENHFVNSQTDHMYRLALLQLFNKGNNLFFSRAAQQTEQRNIQILNEAIVNYTPTKKVKSLLQLSINNNRVLLISETYKIFIQSSPQITSLKDTLKGTEVLDVHKNHCLLFSNDEFFVASSSNYLLISNILELIEKSAVITASHNLLVKRHFDFAEILNVFDNSHGQHPIINCLLNIKHEVDFIKGEVQYNKILFINQIINKGLVIANQKIETALYLKKMSRLESILRQEYKQEIQDEECLRIFSENLITNSVNKFQREFGWYATSIAKQNLYMNSYINKFDTKNFQYSLSYSTLSFLTTIWGFYYTIPFSAGKIIEKDSALGVFGKKIGIFKEQTELLNITEKTLSKASRYLFETGANGNNDFVGPVYAIIDDSFISKVSLFSSFIYDNIYSLNSSLFKNKIKLSYGLIFDSFIIKNIFFATSQVNIKPSVRKEMHNKEFLSNKHQTILTISSEYKWLWPKWINEEKTNLYIRQVNCFSYEDKTIK